jgi:hypothetical protein
MYFQQLLEAAVNGAAVERVRPPAASGPQTGVPYQQGDGN